MGGRLCRGIHLAPLTVNSRRRAEIKTTVACVIFHSLLSSAVFHPSFTNCHALASLAARFCDKKLLPRLTELFSIHLIERLC